MKCFACNYEYGQGLDEESTWKILHGDKPFIYLKRVHPAIESDYDFFSDKKVSLYACPKCGTVRMEN